jgi:hypothetical protein
VILDKLQELLECAEELLEIPVCRTFINPGPDAPHDVCSTVMRDGVMADGQMWAAQAITQEGWPSPTGLPHTCTTAFADLVEIGIVRCAAKLSNNGDPPSPEKVTADAYKQQADKVALRAAILCCWNIELQDIIIVDWQAIPPAGGCVGGVWTLEIRDGGCGCGELES